MFKKSKFIITIVSSILLMIASISLITTGVILAVQEGGLYSDKSDDVEKGTIYSGKTYRIKNDYAYIISSGSYTKMKVYVYGTTNESINKLTVKKSTTSSSLVAISTTTSSAYVVYEYNISSSSKYIIDFSNINTSSNSVFEVQFS